MALFVEADGLKPTYAPWLGRYRRVPGLVMQW